MSPPPLLSFSKTVTSTPSLASKCAQESPAGPAPMMATFFPVDGLRENSCHFSLMALSVAYRCSLAMGIGSSCIKLYTQLPSHNFSTGQTLEQPPPNMFDSKMVCAEPRILSVVICLINFGMLMLVGHCLMQGAS